jgi:hypothetical protein
MTLTNVTGLVLIIVALCQALKYAGVNTRWIPIISILLGLIGSIILGGPSWMEMATGIISGLTASGLYSGYKKTIISK